MQTISSNYIDAINSKVRRVVAKAELYNSEALIATYTQNDAIKSIDIERVGEESKFFGFGVTHKMNIKLIDVSREINLTTANHFKISFGVKLANDSIEYVSFPKMYITEVNRDEITNELSITAYDLLNSAKGLYFSDLTLETPYTIKNVVEAVASALGASGVAITNEANSLLKVELPSYSGDSWTSNGITFTRNADGTLTLNGTNNGVNNSAYYFYNQVAGGDQLILEEGETYVASNFEDENIMFVFFDGTNYQRKDGQTWEAVEGSVNYSQVYIQVPKGDTTIFENYTISPFLGKQTPVFDIDYPNGANFEGTETLQEVLKAAAEATQTIYFMSGSDHVVFKMLDKDGEAVKVIDRNIYFSLDNKTNRRLQTICSATELGDNVSASITEIGTTQYVRDNPFWELRDDVDILVDNAIAAIGGITINQFDCSWRGDMALEIGDKIKFITKDNGEAISYLLNDSFSYSGGLEEETSWSYEESEETESNPSTLGEALKQTYARVDKANKQVDIVVSETAANSEAISNLQLTTDSISASVSSIETNTNNAIDDLNEEVSTLKKQVDLKMTDEEVIIAIKSELENGVSKVQTETGFTFDDTGLNISKTGSEMSSNFNEDGLLIKRDDEEMLKASHEGVDAYNLHAKTYLIIGETSRFEDYEKNGDARTGCFWLGGAD